MESLEAEFNFKARYYKLGTISPATKQVWFVLHGYGQLASYFLKKFELLAADGHCVIAPEGLSRFYLKDSDGRVGATWMTRENRLTDIENYIRYLNRVYQQEIPKSMTAKITLLGFSQGAATVFRWALQNEIHFDRLILWAGLFPPDVNFEKGRELLTKKEVMEIYGTKDPYITQEKYEEMILLNKKLSIPLKLITFEGGHEIDQQVLRQLQ